MRNRLIVNTSPDPEAQPPSPAGLHKRRDVTLSQGFVSGAASIAPLSCFYVVYLLRERWFYSFLHAYIRIAIILHTILV